MTPEDAADTRTLVAGTEFDALGRLVAREYGNGMDRIYGWDPLWGSLKTASASFDDGGIVPVQADTYTRDGAGRVTQVADAVAGVSQCYAYDGFNRLGSAWTDTRSSSTCAGGVSAAVQPLLPLEDLGYAVQYAYESTGEVHSITDLLVTANATFTYAYTDPSSLNAVTAVTGGATSSSFEYDSAGRMTLRTVDATTTGLVWDVSSNLVATMGQSADRVYVYDASGQRVAQLKVGSVTSPTPQSATVYLGATEATDADTATAGNVSATRFFSIGGATVGTATATTGGPAQWAMLLGDVQGSAQVSMELEPDTGEATGFAPAAQGDHEVTRNAYEPYGARRGADALVTDRGWLGQYEDDAVVDGGTGLTYLNARYYDPVLGRFLSPDPLMDPGDPRTLDPYRYADNNPISFTDATGLCSGFAGNTAAIAACAKAGASAYITLPKVKAQAEKGVAAQKAEGAAKTNTSPKGSQSYNPPGNTSSIMVNGPYSTPIVNGTSMAELMVQQTHDWHRAAGTYDFRHIIDVAGFNDVLSDLLSGKPHRPSLRNQLLGPFSPTIHHAQTGIRLYDYWKSGGPHDFKTYQRDLFGVAYDVQLSLDGTDVQIRADALGNIQFGYLMASWGVDMNNAVAASNVGTDATGVSDSDDDMMIRAGYELYSRDPRDLTYSSLVGYLNEVGAGS